jgi:hypothetical protein
MDLANESRRECRPEVHPYQDEALGSIPSGATIVWPRSSVAERVYLSVNLCRAVFPNIDFGFSRMKKETAKKYGKAKREGIKNGSSPSVAGRVAGLLGSRRNGD